MLSPHDAQVIDMALREVEADLTATDPAYTGEFEDYFFFVENELIQRVGAEVAGRLHTGRSRNDIDHTIFKMALRERFLDMMTCLDRFVLTLLTIANQNRNTLVIAYTHGQPAQPTTYAHYLGAMIEIGLRDMGRLKMAAEPLDECPMGAAAITTTGFPIDRQRMAELLGFRRSQENSYGCIAACDYATGLYANLKVMFINLGRFTQDLGFWSSFEVGQLWVGDDYVQVSSIMPQKRNPVPVEHLRQLSSQGAGYCDQMINTMHNTPFTDISDHETSAQVAGFAAFDIARRVLTLLSGLMVGARIDEKRVRQNISRSCIKYLHRIKLMSFPREGKDWRRISPRLTPGRIKIIMCRYLP